MSGTARRLCKALPWRFFHDKQIGWTFSFYGSKQRNPLVALVHWNGEWRFMGRWPFRE